MKKADLETENAKLRTQLHHTRTALTNTRAYAMKASWEGKRMDNGEVIKMTTEGLERGK